MTRAKHNILIVDDEEAIRDSLGMVLEEEGFQTRTAKDGSEALEKARTHDYDLIILDYFMPKRSGLDILEQLKEYCPKADVLILSSYYDSEKANQAITKGAQQYLLKPIDFDELIGIVKNIFAGKKNHS